MPRITAAELQELYLVDSSESDTGQTHCNTQRPAERMGSRRKSTARSNREAARTTSRFNTENEADAAFTQMAALRPECVNKSDVEERSAPLTSSEVTSDNNLITSENVHSETENGNSFSRNFGSRRYPRSSQAQKRSRFRVKSRGFIFSAERHTMSSSNDSGLPQRRPSSSIDSSTLQTCLHNGIFDTGAGSEDEIVTSSRTSATSRSYVNSLGESPHSNTHGSHQFLDGICISEGRTFVDDLRINTSNKRLLRNNSSRNNNSQNSSRHSSVPSMSTDSDQILVGVIMKGGNTKRGKYTLNSQQNGGFSCVEARDKFKKQLVKFETAQIIKRLYPRSLQLGTKQELQPTKEREFLYQVMAADAKENHDFSDQEGAYSSIPLSNFSVYRAFRNGKMKGQLESLHNVAVDQHEDMFYLDGTVLHKGQRMYVEEVQIKQVSIGGYDDPSIHTTRGLIWVQSELGSRYDDIWYSLDTPAPEYEDLWQKFLWLADLTKHFVDYLCASKQDNIGLGHFKSKFVHWLHAKHHDSLEFSQWHKKCGNRLDLRQDIATYRPFLYNQCHNLSRTLFHEHKIWDQIYPGWNEITVPLDEYEKTVVTKHVGQSFLRAFPHWGKVLPNGRPGYNLLEIVYECDEVSKSQEARRSALNLPNKMKVSQADNFQDIPGEGLKSKVDLILQNAYRSKLQQIPSAKELKGKIVVVETLRNKQQDSEFRYALVKGSSWSGSMLEVVWLLTPSQISCIKGAHYSIGNELFLSDRCNCGLVPLSKVYSVHVASLLTDHAQHGAELLVSDLYLETDGMFITGHLSDLEFQCNCQRIGSRRQSTDRQRSEAVPKTHKDGRKMNVCCLFSGCGLLDAGMHSSGACEMVFANDVNAAAMQSHAANQPSLCCKHVTGTVNRCLRRFLLGIDPLLDIDCLVAGCPCQGFSSRNKNRGSKASQKNCSLLASTLSHAELYSPAYVVIENVPHMDRGGDPTGCAQAVATLVALGYQVQKWMLMASWFGTAQRRKRLFIIATASGFQVPEVPVPTHSESAIWLKREVTASQATAGLGPVDNDVVVNIMDPSHVPVERLRCNFETVSLRSVVSKIPKKPRGRHNLYTTWQGNLLKQHESDWAARQTDQKLTDTAGTLRRINPHKPISTMLTYLVILDAWCAGVIHWDEDRTLTLAEVRAFMDIPHDMVLIGTPKEQLKQAGNGVPLKLGSAVGEMVAQAWFASISGKSTKRQDSAPQEPARRRSTREIRSSQSTRGFEGTTEASMTQITAIEQQQDIMPTDEVVVESIEHDDTIMVQHGTQSLEVAQRSSQRISATKTQREVVRSSAKSRFSGPSSQSLSKRRRDGVNGARTLVTTKVEDDDELTFLYEQPVHKKSRALTKS